MHSTFLLLAFTHVPIVAAWSSEELTLYDLVEELNNANFYEIYGIQKDASLGEVKKAWRRLSLENHPDKNSAPDANEKFRQFTAIYDVLKSKELRAKYDEVLEFGLPDWRQPIFYYRRVRKLSWMEAVILLLLTFSVAHYLMLWGAYFEKYLVESNRKVKRKKQGEEEARRELILAEYRPSLLHTLPVLIIRGFIWIVRAIPSLGQSAMEQWRREEEKEGGEEEHVFVRRSVAPQPVFEYEVASNIRPVSTLDPVTQKRLAAENEAAQSQQVTNAPWTAEELQLLVKLSTEKFPAGSPNRWTEIARALRRNENDVTKMVGKMKHVKREDFAMLARGQTSAAVAESTTTAHKSEVEDEEPDEAKALVNEWTQTEQRLFETALQQFPKGTPGRWEKIEACVPNRSRQECIERFKRLTELVRSRKNMKKK